EVPRAEVVQRLRAALSALDSGVMVPSDAAVVVRAAAGMERPTPGVLERALAADARGRHELARRGGGGGAQLRRGPLPPWLRARARARGTRAQEGKGLRGRTRPARGAR